MTRILPTASAPDGAGDGISHRVGFEDDFLRYLAMRLEKELDFSSVGPQK